MPPWSLALRHYLCLGRAHFERKYGRRRYDPAELAEGWHRWRLGQSPEGLRFPSDRDLRTYVSDQQLDASSPRTRHLPRRRRVDPGSRLYAEDRRPLTQQLIPHAFHAARDTQQAMSLEQANVDVVRRQFQALERGGPDGAAEFWHTDIDWRAVEGAADDVGVMRGHDALRRYYEEWFQTFDQLRAEVEEVIFEGDDRVAVSVRNSGRGRASGVVTEGRYYVACTVRDGQIVSGREYATRDQALEAVGLRE
jgi:ketosteroid isomerase-like protein